MLLNILDGYPLHVEIKGGFVPAEWERVVITANEPPDSWYQRGFPAPLQRRITRIIHMTGPIKVMDDHIADAVGTPPVAPMCTMPTESASYHPVLSMPSPSPFVDHTTNPEPLSDPIGIYIYVYHSN